MTKKIYSILALLCIAVSGAWAEGKTVFEFADPVVGTLTHGTGTSTTTVKIHAAEISVAAIKLGKSYKYAEGQFLTIAPSVGSFKKGDVVTIAGCTNLYSTDKHAKAVIYAADGTTMLYETANGIDGTSTYEDPVVETFTLTQNTESLLIGRSGDTGYFITTLKVESNTIDVTPTENPNEWTFTMPGYDVEVGVEYETALALSEVDDNTATLEEWDGYEADVTLTRTLQAGMWNTLALPFNVEATTLAAINAKLALMGGSMTVKELATSSYADGTLTLNFGDATSMKAGTPYLVKVVAPMALNLATMPFTDAEVSKTAVTVETTAVDFVPTLGLTEVTVGDTKEILFLATGNTLLYPTELPANMKGFRAYFQLKGEAAGARSFQLNFGDGETTGIQTIDNGQLKIDNEVYDLSGRRVNSAAQKGVYVVNGKKVIIK